MTSVGKSNVVGSQDIVPKKQGEEQGVVPKPPQVLGMYDVLGKVTEVPEQMGAGMVKSGIGASVTVTVTEAVLVPQVPLVTWQL